MRPLRVFLDSSDYSDLSDPKKLATGLDSTLQRLYSIRDQGGAQFYFSATIIGEMTPLDPLFASAAMRRGRLLADLCRKNVLVATDRLLAHELRLALSIDSLLPSVYSDVGDWTPEGALDLLPKPAAEHSQMIRETIKEVAP